MLNEVRRNKQADPFDNMNVIEEGNAWRRGFLGFGKGFEWF